MAPPPAASPSPAPPPQARAPEEPPRIALVPPSRPPDPPPAASRDLFRSPLPPRPDPPSEPPRAEPVRRPESLLLDAEADESASSRRPHSRVVALAAAAGIGVALFAVLALWFAGWFGGDAASGQPADGEPIVASMLAPGAVPLGDPPPPEEPAPDPSAGAGPVAATVTPPAAAPAPVRPPPAAVRTPVARPATTVDPPTLLAAPADAGWVVFDVPVGLAVSRDGALLGSTTQRLMLPVGTYRLQLASQALEYSTEVDVRVGAGGTSTTSVTLPEGRLAITATPWADVTIDGRPVGRTPISSMPLRIGTYEVVWTHPELGERRRFVTVPARTPAAVGINLGEPPAPDEVATPPAARAGDGASAARATPEPGRVYTADDPRVVAPVEIMRTMPLWTPDDSVPRGTYQGVIEVVVDERGLVRSATMRRSAHPSYDALAVAATSTWRFRPATLDGTPVAFRKSFEVIVHTRRNGGD